MVPCLNRDKVFAEGGWSSEEFYIYLTPPSCVSYRCTMSRKMCRNMSGPGGVCFLVDLEGCAAST